MGTAQAFKNDLLGAIPSLRAFAVSLAQNADKADDLVQETLVKAWDKQGSFQPGTNLKAWLFTILRNEFYSQMRKRGREVQDSDGLMTARLAVHPSQHGMLDLEDFRAALRALARRPARGDHPDRRVRLLLRGSGRDLQLRRRHDQEPGQPRPQPAAGNPEDLRRGRVSGRMPSPPR